MVSAILGYSDVLVGTQYGDEGKGKTVDKKTKSGMYGIVARYNGGKNAGHTLEEKGRKIVLHQVPSAIFSRDIQLYIGSGCALDLEKLEREIAEITSFGIDLSNRLNISDKALITCPHHIMLDAELGKELGTTGSGMGPAYADRAMRAEGSRLKHLRFADLLDNPSMAIEVIVENAMDRGLDSRERIEAKAHKILEAAKNLEQYVPRDPLWLLSQVNNGENVLFEGAQATLLDVTHGTVPFVTASHTIAGNAYVGGDLPPKYHRKTFGVAKAIMSRVGNGPFVSEFGGSRSEHYCAEERGKRYTKAYERTNYNVEELLKSDDPFHTGIALRILGEEYGATTGRPRRLGMLDLVALKYAVDLNGIDELHLTKVDRLVDFSRTQLPGIPIVVAYEVDGRNIDYLPTSTDFLKTAKPIIEYRPHIKEDLSGMRNFSDLPPEAKELIRYIETSVGCKISSIGVGPEREQYIDL